MHSTQSVLRTQRQTLSQNGCSLAFGAGSVGHDGSLSETALCCAAAAGKPQLDLAGCCYRDPPAVSWCDSLPALSFADRPEESNQTVSQTRGQNWRCARSRPCKRFP